MKNDINIYNIFTEPETFPFEYDFISVNNTFANVSWKQPQQCKKKARYTVHQLLKSEVVNESIYSNISTNSVKISKDFQFNDMDLYKYYIEANCNNTFFLSDTSLQFSKEGKS